MTTSRISGIIPLLFITLLCVGMVEGGYLMFEHFVLDPRPRNEIDASVNQAEQSESKTVVQQKIGPEVILQRNLFGALTGDKPAAPSVPAKTEAPTATSLQIVLMGTVTGSEGTERAIILDKAKKKQELFNTGDEVQGALVKEIRRGKVILAQNGREEILDISEAAKMRPRVPIPAPPPPVVPVKNAAPPEKNINPPEVEPQPPPAEAAADTPTAGEGSEPNATQIRLSRVSHTARGQQPSPNNLRSNATQHQGNINE